MQTITTIQSSIANDGFQKLFPRVKITILVLVSVLSIVIPATKMIRVGRIYFTPTETRPPTVADRSDGMNEAANQADRIASTLEKTKAILASAKSDRANLANELKGMGIRSAGDIKGNSVAKRTAEDIGRISNEIDSYERKIAAISTQLLQAKAIVRRREMEQSGLSEEELAELYRQLYESDTNSDGWTKSITPMDVEREVNKALQYSAMEVAPKYRTGK